MCDDSKINVLVESVNKLGIETAFSCEGHTSPDYFQSPIPRIVTIPISKIPTKNLLRLFLALSYFNNKVVIQEDFWCLIPQDTQEGCMLVLTPISRHVVSLETHQNNISRLATTCKEIADS